MNELHDLAVGVWRRRSILEPLEIFRRHWWVARWLYSTVSQFLSRRCVQKTNAHNTKTSFMYGIIFKMTHTHTHTTADAAAICDPVCDLQWLAWAMQQLIRAACGPEATSSTRSGHQARLHFVVVACNLCRIDSWFDSQFVRFFIFSL